MDIPAYAFTQEDSRNAYEVWGANCGPNALAQCVGYTLDQVRFFLHADFEKVKYMSPTMMEKSLLGLARLNKCPSLFKGWPMYGLVRIQWTGPWTAPGSNPRWAYHHTHWVHSFVRENQIWIFDVNGGWMLLEKWEAEIVPAITQQIKRADGKYTITHTWGVGGFPAGSKWRPAK